MCACVSTGAPGVQKVLEALKLELTDGCELLHVGAGNCLVFCRSSKLSYPPSHFFSLLICTFKYPCTQNKGVGGTVPERMRELRQARCSGTALWS